MPATAFPAPVLANQAVFRALMDALARPGTVKPLVPAAGAPSPLTAAAAAVALALLDYETPVWLDAPLAQSREVADWIRLHAGAPVTSDPRQAAMPPMRRPSTAFRSERLNTRTARPRLCFRWRGSGTGNACCSRAQASRM
jgi:alpha-D-ribose 1-methylphosphonate 5-triphosphate synthase subunit PhnH